MRAPLLPLLMLFAGPALAEAPTVTYGVRPAYLISQMDPGPLKDQLMACEGQTPSRSRFSIGHRGAPLMFPEHTVESNVAAAQMGAGILECDVTFTKEHALICRHAQDDLHSTTNILATDLAATCTLPFTPARDGQPAQARCLSSDITLEQFRSLAPKMDAFDPQATSVEAYLGGTAPWRTDLYTGDATLMTHAESIALFDALGADFTPELKAPAVPMPHDGLSQQDYAQKLIDEYKAAGIAPDRVWPQSFELEDILYWIEAEPEFGAQAIYLMDEYRLPGYSPNDPGTWPHSMAELKAMGVNIIAPPTWMLVTLDGSEIVPSALAREAQAAGLEIVTWTLERSGPLAAGGGWYYQSIRDVTQNDGAVFDLLHVLAQDVGIRGVFSDWPATVTYYANCFGLE